MNTPTAVNLKPFSPNGTMGIAAKLSATALQTSSNFVLRSWIHWGGWSREENKKKTWVQENVSVPLKANSINTWNSQSPYLTFLICFSRQNSDDPLSKRAFTLNHTLQPPWIVREHTLIRLFWYWNSRRNPAALSDAKILVEDWVCWSRVTIQRKNSN